MSNEKDMSNKMTNLPLGKLRAIYLKKFCDFLKGISPNEYDLILPGERQQLAYAIGMLQDNDGYDIHESIDLKDSNKTEI